MQKQAGFTLLLILMVLMVGALTVIAFQHEGAGLFQVFFNNIRAGGWNGQFNADFATYLGLSGLWIMWRNRFTPASIVMAFAAMIIGIILFAPYLIYLLNKEQGDLKKVLVGER